MHFQCAYCGQFGSVQARELGQWRSPPSVLCKVCNRTNRFPIPWALVVYAVSLGVSCVGLLLAHINVAACLISMVLLFAAATVVLNSAYLRLHPMLAKLA